MGILAVDLFITLDGVYQAPGGPEEDSTGGFGYGAAGRLRTSTTSPAP